MMVFEWVVYSQILYVVIFPPYISTSQFGFMTGTGGTEIVFTAIQALELH